MCVLNYKDTDSPIQKQTLNLDEIKNKSWFILAHLEIWDEINHFNSFSLVRLPDSLQAGNFAQFNPALHDNQFDTHLPTPKSFSSSIFFYEHSVLFNFFSPRTYLAQILWRQNYKEKVL